MSFDHLIYNPLPMAKLVLEASGVLDKAKQKNGNAQALQDYIATVPTGMMPVTFQNNNPAMPTMGGRADDYIKMAYDAMPVQAFGQNMVSNPTTQQYVPRHGQPSKPSGGK